MTSKNIGIGIVGAGFIARFHTRSWQSIRDSDIVAVASRTLAKAQSLGDYAEELGVGVDVQAYDDVAELVRDPRVDAVWVLTPNDTRVEVVRAIVDEVISRPRFADRHRRREAPRAHLREAQDVAEAVRAAGLLHGYLENQVYAPRLTRTRDVVWERGAGPAGSPYLARCLEEHSGPALAVVLGRREAGRRRAQRPDVPFRRGGALPSDPAGSRPGSRGSRRSP